MRTARLSKVFGVLLAAGLCAAAWGQRVSQDAGLDRPGGDYNQFNARDARDCQDACARDRRCRAYAWKSNVCYLKDRVSGTTQDYRVVSGVKDGYGNGGGYDPGYEDLSEERGVDYNGGHYTSFPARGGLRECQDGCRRDRRCIGYTYDLRGGTCYLKDRVGRAERDRDKVSGFKRGYGPGNPNPYPPPGGPGGGNLPNVTEREGYDYKGGDYTSFRARGLRDCQFQCRRDSRCRAYTFSNSSGMCYLKDRIGDFKRDGDKVTGVKQNVY
jgi:hypothetical protein